MDSFLQERLEEYLSGDLTPAERERFEKLLAADPAAEATVAEFASTAALFEAIRVPQEEVPELAPGFYVRLRENLDREAATPFWAVFTQPFILKRLAFASLMWMFALGALTVMVDDTPQRTTQLADMILSEQPPADYHVRMGPNLEQNRDSMLAVMFTGE